MQPWLDKHDTSINNNKKSNNLIDPKFISANGQNKRVVKKYLLKE